MQNALCCSCSVQSTPQNVGSVQCTVSSFPGRTPCGCGGDGMGWPCSAAVAVMLSDASKTRSNISSSFGRRWSMKWHCRYVMYCCSPPVLEDPEQGEISPAGACLWPSAVWLLGSVSDFLHRVRVRSRAAAAEFVEVNVPISPICFA